MHISKWIGFLLVALLALPVRAADSITIVADEWCPYNCGEKSKEPGYIIEIARAAFKKEGIDVIYHVMPWAQAVSMTRQGQFNAVVAANRGDAPDFIFPELVQGISINQAWVRNDSAWTYKGLSSLDGLRIGIVEGYFYGKDINPYLARRMRDGNNLIKIASSDSATDYNIEQLVAGNIDVILEDKNVVKYYFSSRGQPMGVKAVGTPVDINNVDDTYLFLAFGPNQPKSKEYARMLTRRMQEMRNTGELKAILARYKIDNMYRFRGED